MWIRSQSKKILIEIHNVEIDCRFNVWGDSSLIGKYSTEEKALEVLERIEKYLTYPYPYGEVFQMPQDEDVEV